MSFHHHTTEHIDDVVVFLHAVLDDLLDGVVELLVVPNHLRDVLVDVVHVLLELLRGDDIPFFELLRGDDIPLFFELLLVHDGDIPLSSLSNHLSYPLSSLSTFVVLDPQYPCPLFGRVRSWG